MIMTNKTINQPIVVIDVETTGLFPFRNDRIVEIAAVVLDQNLKITNEFVSLVNPGRDIGPSRIHGLTAEDVIRAPAFSDLYGHIYEIMNGSLAIAGHNIRFDKQFLESEMTKIGLAYPEPYSVCTMRLTGGGNLKKSCFDYGIPFDGRNHSALDDARATAKLLAFLLPDSPQLLTELSQQTARSWPSISNDKKSPVIRSQSSKYSVEKPDFLNRLADIQKDFPAGPLTESSMLAYSALLDRVLEDRRIDENENAHLFEIAKSWGISCHHAELIHREYLRQLAKSALSDGIVTDSERRDLKLVSRLLGIDPDQIDKVLIEAENIISDIAISNKPIQVSDDSLEGKTVCFTGEFNCLFQGKPITREMAYAFAVKANMVPAESVTKKLDLLIVADPHSLSGKAKKARVYGIRIVHEPVFWKLLNIEVT